MQVNHSIKSEAIHKDEALMMEKFSGFLLPKVGVSKKKI
jgi:hypothetical protein